MLNDFWPSAVKSLGRRMRLKDQDLETLSGPQWHHDQKLPGQVFELDPVESFERNIWAWLMKESFQTSWRFAKITRIVLVVTRSGVLSAL
jgi:hypothetical protein